MTVKATEWTEDYIEGSFWGFHHSSIPSAPDEIEECLMREIEELCGASIYRVEIFETGGKAWNADNDISDSERAGNFLAFKD